MQPHDCQGMPYMASCLRQGPVGRRSSREWLRRHSCHQEHSLASGTSRRRMQNHRGATQSRSCQWYERAPRWWCGSTRAERMECRACGRLCSHLDHIHRAEDQNCQCGFTELRLWDATYINDNIHVEASFVSWSTSRHEMVDGRVGRDNLVVVSSRSIKSSKCYRVGPGARSPVGQRLSGACLRG